MNHLSQLKSGKISTEEQCNLIRTCVLSDNVTHIDKLLEAGADVNNLLEAGVDVNAGIKEEALYVSALEGKDQLVKHLIDKGADVNSAIEKNIAAIHQVLHNPKCEPDGNTSTKHTALIIAAERGYHQCVLSLLQAGTDFLSFLKSSDTTPKKKVVVIQAVVGSGSIEHVNEVIEAGAEVNGINVMSEALIAAAKIGNLVLLRSLIDKGADVNISSLAEFTRPWETKTTPLIHAARSGKSGCVGFLIQAGADIREKFQEKSERYITPTHEKLEIVEAVVRSGNLEHIKTILDAGASVHDLNVKNEALIWAAKVDNLELIRYLIEEGADVNTTSFDVHTPLTAAAEGGYTESVKFLLEKGADVNKQQCWYDTPLIIGAKSGHFQCVKVLIKSGADISAKDVSGLSAMHHAVQCGHDTCVHMLIETGADVNSSYFNRNSLLMAAAEKGYSKCVQLLIAAGADVKAEYDSETALMCAAKDGHATSLNLLIRAGADVNKADRGWITLLIYAAGQNIESIDLLI